MSARDSKEEKRTQGVSGHGEVQLQAVRVFVEGPGPSVEPLLWSSGTLVVGSSEGCDLVLGDPTVSRRHLSALLMPGQIQLQDLGSRNGTFYLGARISEANVPLGGAVRVGKTTLTFRPAAAPPIAPVEPIPGLVGRSEAMARIAVLVRKLSASEAPVLITGETGVGKGTVARAIHDLGPRSQGPWVVVECGGANSSLVDSRLFGHAKGAFTGAVRDQAGLIEQSQGGTLCLDGVDELPLEVQAKLLRALETQTIRRLGDWAERRIDFRLIATSAKPLDEQVAAGRFRADLYHRLAVTELHVPALRERVEDIPLLALHFAQQVPDAAHRLDAIAMAALQSSSWAGNVRELKNAVVRLVTLGPLAEAARAEGTSFSETRKRVLDEFERAYIVGLLARHGNNVTAAAREAKLARSHFYRLLERNGLVPSKQ